MLRVDERSQIQALDRTVAILPMQEGRIERRSHDYCRHQGLTVWLIGLVVAIIAIALKTLFGSQLSSLTSASTSCSSPGI